jgi:tetratricopeptide (TPR) repeat protein
MLQRRYPEAVAELEQALRLKPDRYHAYLRLAEVYQRQGQPDQALAQLDKALARAPALPALYRARARLHARRPDPQAALRDLQQAIDLEPPDSPSVELAEDHVERGRILQHLRRYPEAVRAYEAALKVWPTPLTEAGLRPVHAAAHLGRGEVLLKQERYQEAARSLEQHLRLAGRGKGSAEVFRTRGLARAMGGDYPGAVKLVRMRGSPHSKGCPAGSGAPMADAVKNPSREFQPCLSLDGGGS